MPLFLITNSNLEWKYLTSVGKETTVSISDLNFNELIIQIQRSTSVVYANIHICKAQLSDEVKVFIAGNYTNSSTAASLAVNITRSELNLHSVYQNGEDVTATSTMTIFYK